MAKLTGKDTSLWLDTTPETSYPKLSGDISVDAAIAGGGITGLLIAWFLQSQGLKTAVVDKARIVQNTTGNTTAKLTSQHYLVYNYLTNEFGEKVAKTYAEANENAIDDIEKLAKKLRIDCDFSRRDAYVYTNDDKKVSDVEDEVKAAKKIGLPATFETKTDLHFDVKAAVKFSNQAQFHPRKFLLGVANELNKAGGQIFEETEVSDIKTGKENILVSKNGKIKAKYIIEATKYPFWKPDMFKKHTWTKLSYALGVLLRKNQYPQGMYITTDEPTRTIRSHPYKGGQMLIFGGEAHKMEPGYDKNEHYQKLIDDVHKKYDVKKIMYRWIAGDNMTYDRMPYIGQYPEHPNIFIATGFRAWGLAWAMAAAHIIVDKIMKKPVDWAKPFSLDRLKS